MKEATKGDGIRQMNFKLSETTASKLEALARSKGQKKITVVDYAINLLYALNYEQLVAYDTLVGDDSNVLPSCDLNPEFELRRLQMETVQVRGEMQRVDAEIERCVETSKNLSPTRGLRPLIASDFNKMLEKGALGVSSNGQIVVIAEYLK